MFKGHIINSSHVNTHFALEKDNNSKKTSESEGDSAKSFKSRYMSNGKLVKSNLYSVIKGHSTTFEKESVSNKQI